jgi:Raf kinase inhibitor-like YbhB/YbcL family protein
MRSLLLVTVFVFSGMFVSAQLGLVITSTAFTNKGVIPSKYSCEGANINPPIDISNAPSGTQSYALIIHDADADTLGGFTHWVLWDILPDNPITENYKGAKQGLNSAGTRGYTGMCPPKDNHHYTFTVYALNTKRLNIPPDANKRLLESAIKEHILAAGEIMGMYQKQKK